MVETELKRKEGESAKCKSANEDLRGQLERAQKQKRDETLHMKEENAQLVREGDTITIDIGKRTMDVEVSDEEMARRRAEWSPPPLRATRGTLHKYIKTVSSARYGAVTDE